MPRLTALSALRFRLLRRRPGVRMLRAGRQRGVLRSFIRPGFPFVQPRFQFVNLSQQSADNRLRFRRLTSNQCFRDFQRHALFVAEIRFHCQISFVKISFRGVNGYVQIGSPLAQDWDKSKGRVYDLLDRSNGKQWHLGGQIIDFFRKLDYFEEGIVNCEIVELSNFFRKIGMVQTLG